jgi:peptidoglycan hydrolase-like protein with peptidoglycan-binding domain
MGPKTKEALRQFQLENGLPVGNLDFETLHALGM